MTFFRAFLLPLFSRCPIFFLSRPVASRPFLSSSLSLLFPLFPKNFSAFATFLSIFSLALFLSFPCPFRRYHLSARSLSLFHFSIVKGKIMYLSAAFLLPLLLAGRSYVLALHCPATGDEDLLAAFRSFHGRDTSRVANLARKLRGCRLVVYLLTFVTCKQQENGLIKFLYSK